MKTKLSAWNYVKNNKKVVAVLVTALALSFIAMYAIHVLLQTTTESFRPILLELPKQVSYADLKGKAYGLSRGDYETYEEYEAAYFEKQAALTEALKKRPGIEEVVYAQVLNCRYQSVIGEFYYEVPLLAPDQIQGFLDHVGARLTEGRMPVGDGEVLADEVIMKNAGIKIGDWFRKEAYGETFRIVGAIRSENHACVGTPMGYTNSGRCLVVYNDKTTTDLKGILREEGIVISPEDSIYDLNESKATFRKDVEGVISTVISSISLVVTIFLSLLVIVAYVSFLRNRINEYCLYASIGYGRNEIYGMILREMLLLFIIGTLIGLIASLGVGIVLTEFLITPRGLIGKMIYLDRILRILGIFAFVMGMLQIPIIVCVSKIKTIDAIED